MEYEKCLVQVFEILNHLEEEEIEKIPKELIAKIIERKDKNYIWNYDETKPLNEQILDRKTIAMLSYINIEYLLDEEQRDYIIKLHEINEERVNPKIKTVNFVNPMNYEEDKNIQESNLIEIKKLKWYEKIVKFLKRIFIK